MKKIILILLAVIVIAVGAAIWFVATLDLNSYIPKIEQMVKEKSDSDLSIGKLGVSFKGGFALTAQQVSWKSADDALALSAQLNEFSLRLRLLPLLTGSLEVSKLILDQPVITIVQSKKLETLPAEVTATGLVAVSPKTPRPQKAEGSVEDVSPSAPPLPLRNFNLNSLQVKDGVVIYQDDATQEAKRFSLEKINIRVQSAPDQKYEMKGSALFESTPLELRGSVGPLNLPNFQPEELPFRVEITADNLLFKLIQKASPKFMASLEKVQINGSESLTLTVEGTPQNIKMNYFQTGTEQSIQIDDMFIKKAGMPLELKIAGRLSDENKFYLEKSQVDLSQISLKGSGDFPLGGTGFANLHLEASPFPLSNLGELVPKVRDLGLGGICSLNLDVKQFNLMTQTGSLQGVLNFENFTVQPQLFKSPLETKRLSFLIADNKIIWTPTVFSWGGGKVEAKGEVTDYLKFPGLVLKSSVTQVDLEKALNISGTNTDKASVALSGLLSGEMDLAGKEAQNISLVKAVAGNFHFLIEKGAIRNLNIIDEVGKQSSKIPGLSGSVTDALKKRFPRLANSPDTEFEKADVLGQVGQGIVTISQLAIASPEFNIVGRGQYVIETQILNFSGKLIFSLEATEALMSSVKELGALRDSEGRLTFSFTVFGKGQDIQVSLLKELLQDALQKILLGGGVESLFGKKKEETKTDAAKTDAPKTETTETSSPKAGSLDDLIQMGLDSFLKKPETNK